MNAFLRAHRVLPTGICEERRENGLRSNANAMNFDRQQFAAKVVWACLLIEEACQPVHHRPDNFWVIVKLQGDNANESVGGIRNNVRKVSVQRKQNASQLLRLGDHDWINRTNRQMIPQNQNLMTPFSKRLHYFQRDALVGEKPDFHAASKSARSRANSRHAEMSAAERSGNCSMICPASRPAARYPRSRAAGIRVPLMQAFPRRMCGSLSIRSCHFFILGKSNSWIHLLQPQSVAHLKSAAVD